MTLCLVFIVLMLSPGSTADLKSRTRDDRNTIGVVGVGPPYSNIQHTSALSEGRFTDTYESISMYRLKVTVLLSPFCRTDSFQIGAELLHPSPPANDTMILNDRSIRTAKPGFLCILPEMRPQH